MDKPDRPLTLTAEILKEAAARSRIQVKVVPLAKSVVNELSSEVATWRPAAAPLGETSEDTGPDLSPSRPKGITPRESEAELR